MTTVLRLFGCSCTTLKEFWLKRGSPCRVDNSTSRLSFIFCVCFFDHFFSLLLLVGFFGWQQVFGCHSFRSRTHLKISVTCVLRDRGSVLRVWGSGVPGDSRLCTLLVDFVCRRQRETRDEFVDRRRGCAVLLWKLYIEGVLSSYTSWRSYVSSLI